MKKINAVYHMVSERERKKERKKEKVAVFCTMFIQYAHIQFTNINGYHIIHHEIL